MKNEEMIWATLLHLGTNMWRDENAPKDPLEHPAKGSMTYYADHLEFDLDVFHRLTEKLPELGLNTVLIDLGEGIRYDSHPELAIKGSLAPDVVRDEVHRLRALGLEPVPKLNFSASHDAWLGEYERMISTDIYRKVASDLIHEVCEIFEKPKYFHLGMDEETPSHQGAYGYCAVRGETLWWRDFLHLVDCCERENTRPWIWSDYYWHHPDSFRAKMPRTVLQSNWHYYNLRGEHCELGQNPIGYRTYLDFNEMGFDQVPTTTTWSFSKNTEQLINQLVGEHLDPAHICGFMTAAWMPTLESEYYDILGDAARLGYARREHGGKFAE